MHHDSGFWRIPMFSGKFNPMLDSFYFRFSLTTAAFLVWMGVSYLLLSV